MKKRKTVEQILAKWSEQPGAVVSAHEWNFIAEMRHARKQGVGYGWMLQVIEWEWQANDPNRTAPSASDAVVKR